MSFRGLPGWRCVGSARQQPWRPEVRCNINSTVTNKAYLKSNIKNVFADIVSLKVKAISVFWAAGDLWRHTPLRSCLVEEFCFEADRRTGSDVPGSELEISSRLSLNFALSTTVVRAIGRTYNKPALEHTEQNNNKSILFLRIVIHHRDESTRNSVTLGKKSFFSSRWNFFVRIRFLSDFCCRTKTKPQKHLWPSRKDILNRSRIIHNFKKARFHSFPSPFRTRNLSRSSILRFSEGIWRHQSYLANEEVVVVFEEAEGKAQQKMRRDESLVSPREKQTPPNPHGCVYPRAGLARVFTWSGSGFKVVCLPWTAGWLSPRPATPRARLPSTLTSAETASAVTPSERDNS